MSDTSILNILLGRMHLILLICATVYFLISVAAMLTPEEAFVRNKKVKTKLVFENLFIAFMLALAAIIVRPF